MTDFRVTQDVVETLTTSASDLRVTQHVVEALTSTPQEARVTQDVIELLTSLLLIEVPPPTTGQGHVKAKQGNKHIRTDENGSVKVVAVTAGSGTGPLTPFAHVACDTDDTGALKMAVITLNPPLGPLTDLANLRVCTDENEALLVATQTAGSLLGPLTNLGNIRARTDARGALVVASVAAGSLQTPLTPTLNLRGRTDDQGALVVTGLTNPVAVYQARVLTDGAAAYWPLDDAAGSTSARDLAGTRHALIAGAVTLNQAGVGSSRAMAFTTGSGQLQPPSFPAPTTKFTYEAWARWDTAKVLMGLMTRPSVVIGDFSWSWRAIQDQMRFETDNNSGHSLVQWDTMPFPINTWTYLVITGDATTVTLYINATKFLTPQLQDHTGTGGGTPILAGFTGDTTNGWQGLLQDLAMYQEVLTDPQISLHYTLGLAR